MFSKLNSNQRYGLVVLVFALVYLYLGFQIKVIGFFSGSVGPHHWVMIVASCLIFFSGLLFFSKETFECRFPNFNEWLLRIPFAFIVIVYAYLLPYLGFLITTPLLMTAIGYFFNAKPIKSVISAVLMCLGCYVLFTLMLGISLPSGLWFRNA